MSLVRQLLHLSSPLLVLVPKESALLLALLLCEKSTDQLPILALNLVKFLDKNLVHVLNQIILLNVIDSSETTRHY